MITNNESKRNNFYNLISKKDYDNLLQEEKEKFLLDNEIYISLRELYSKERLDNFKQQEKSIKDKSRIFFWYNDRNTLVLNDIINSYLSNSFGYWSHEYIIDAIKIRLDNAFDNEHKENIIKKEYIKYYKRLHKIKLSYWYFLPEIKYKHYVENNFYHYVQLEIEHETIIKHITSDRVDYHSIKVFKQWSEIEINNGILKFLKDYKSKMSSFIIEKPIIIPNLDNFFKKPKSNKIPIERILNYCKDIFDVENNYDIKKTAALIKELTKSELVSIGAKERASFVRALYQKPFKKIGSINKYFEDSTAFKDGDPIYIEVKRFLDDLNFTS